MQRNEAFLNGWATASSLSARNNPYPEGSLDHSDYEHGYTMSMQENI